MQITFHRTLSHVDNSGATHNFTTEVTKEGIKCFQDGDEQGVFEPSYMPTFVTSLEWCVSSKIIKSFKKGELITVSDRKGYWEELHKDEECE